MPRIGKPIKAVVSSSGKKNMKTWLCVVLVTLFALHGSWAHAAEFSWQKTHAEISATGDIKWSPQPFRFVKGGVCGKRKKSSASGN